MSRGWNDSSGGYVTHCREGPSSWLARSDLCWEGLLSCSSLSIPLRAESLPFTPNLIPVLSPVCFRHFWVSWGITSQVPTLVHDTKGTAARLFQAPTASKWNADVRSLCPLHFRAEWILPLPRLTRNGDSRPTLLPSSPISTPSPSNPTGETH